MICNVYWRSPPHRLVSFESTGRLQSSWHGCRHIGPTGTVFGFFPPRGRRNKARFDVTRARGTYLLRHCSKQAFSVSARLKTYIDMRPFKDLIENRTVHLTGSDVGETSDSCGRVCKPLLQLVLGHATQNCLHVQAAHTRGQ